MDAGMNVDRAIKKIMVQHKAKFGQLFEYDETDEDTHADEEEEKEEEMGGENDMDEEEGEYKEEAI